MIGLLWAILPGCGLTDPAPTEARPAPATDPAPVPEAVLLVAGRPSTEADAEQLRARVENLVTQVGFAVELAPGFPSVVSGEELGLADADHVVLIGACTADAAFGTALGRALSPTATTTRAPWSGTADGCPRSAEVDEAGTPLYGPPMGAHAGPLSVIAFPHLQSDRELVERTWSAVALLHDEAGALVAEQRFGNEGAFATLKGVSAQGVSISVHDAWTSEPCSDQPSVEVGDSATTVTLARGALSVSRTTSAVRAQACAGAPSREGR